MQKGEVDVGRIVRDQFDAELRSAGVFSSVTSENSDAQVRLEVNVYGLAQPHGFSSQLKPTLGVTGKLLRPDGSVVWQKYEYITNLNGQTPPTPWTNTSRTRN
jgi:hypothetical protein